MALNQWDSLYGILQWTAGFLDAEGSVGYYGRALRISCAQKDPELLQKLKRLWGGRLHYREQHGFSVHVWQLSNKEQVTGLLLTLYPLMSQKRQEEIHKALLTWKGKTWPMLTCKRGHPWTSENTYHHQLKNGTVNKSCAICRREAMRAAWHRDPVANFAAQKLRKLRRSEHA